MRRSTIAGILFAFALCLGLIVPTARPTMNAGGPGLASSAAPAAPNRVAPFSLPPAQPTAATIIRTIVYRQISDFQSGGSVGAISVLRMSADGSKVIFASGQKVFTMDTSGQNLREIFENPNPATIPAPRWVDISANGSKVLWATNSVREFFVANADGSNRVPIAPTFQNRFGTNEPLDLRLSPRLTADGRHVYFMQTSSAEVSGGYRVNADGTGLTRLFNYLQVAQLFGRDGSEYNGNIAFRDTLAISDDGSRQVFGTYNFQAAGNAIAFDSVTGLRKLTDFLAGVNERGIALSGDGSRAVVIRRFPDRVSAVAMNFDGSNQIEVAKLTGDGPALGGMSGNGAQALANLASTGSALPLINTDGSGRVDLVVPVDCDVELFRGADAVTTFSLTSDGRRFAFRTALPGQPQQIWIGDINPASTGDAPRITEVTFNPNYVTADRLTSSTFTARAADAQGGQSGLRRRMCSNTLKHGAYEFRYLAGGATFGIALFDNGANGGDQTANDGLFTQTQVFRDLAPPEPTTPLQVRHHAIATSLRQITAVDATPFFVLAQAPSGSGPRIDAITPSSGPAGIQVKITGSGFDPIAGNNIVLFGNRQAVVKTASSDRTMLEVVVPPDLSPGVVSVTVTVAAQTSNAVNFTVTGGTGGGVTLNDHRISGGPIPGACDPPVVKSSFAPTDAQAFQWTFVSGFQNGAVIRWEWVQPNGTIYRQHEAPVNNPNQHVCFWDAIAIAGQPAASLPGAWQVRVFYNGTLLTTDNFTITPSSACTYSIAPASQSFGANGGNGSVTVTTQPGCAWTATSNAGFVTISSGAPGNGSGALNYSVAVNTSASQRSGTLTIAGQTFTVNQSGATAGAPLIRIEPTTLSFNAARGQAQALAQSNQPEQPRTTYAKNEQEQKREAEGDHVQERRDWFYRQRQYPFDQIPERARERAIAEKIQVRERMQFATTEAATEAIAAQWTHIGPSVTTSGAWGKVSGRVTSIIVHPTNPNIVYISGAQGGVWRTTDNGANWMALTDDQPSLAMGALAFDPNNPSVIYAGTGEQNFSLDSYYGNGVLKSTNGGVTWSVLGTATFARQTISRIIVSPSNSQAVLAASNNGLYRSGDGGNTWTRVLAGVATEVIATPGSGSVFYSAIHSSGVYKSTDGGVNWTKLTSGLPPSNFGRIHLTISVASPNTVLASFTARDNKLEGLYRSNDAGANWTKLVNTPNVFGGQGWYNVALGLHPTNANVIYFGGLSLWRTLDGGANWANISNPRDYFLDVHPDQHAVTFNPQNPAVIWLGCDGGVWRSDNGGDTWLSRNDGLSLTQFQTVALHPTNDALAFGGTQDNGIQKYTGNSEWRETRTGDNGSTYFDFNTPTTVYSTYVLGSMLKSLSSGDPGTWATATNGIPFTENVADGRSAFYAPFTMDPTNPLRLAFGSYRVWHTTDGATNWNAVSGDVTGGGVIMAITIAANGARIWTGSSDAQVWRGDLSGSSWSFSNVTKAPLPNRSVTRIAAHPSDPQTAYISYSGFGTEHVFKTTDGGATWTSANSGLPDIPVNAVLVDPNNPGTVYAGTDIGVYRSTEQGQNWMPFGTGLPNVAVFDLALRKNSNVLRAATHGRGMWEIQATGEQSFTIFNDGDATLSVTGITKQNNTAWLSFTTPSAVPFDIPPKGSVPVRVAVNATGLAAGLYTERLLVTSNDVARSPYPTGVFINLNVTGDGNGGGCTFTIAPTSQNVAASGGTGSVNVTAPNGCTWTAKANDDWITITTGASGSGNGAMNYSVAANTSAAARGGTITIAGQTFTITQAGGSNCTFTISPTSRNFDASGGNGSVNVATQSGCNWTATSNADWIIITTGASGAGNGAANYSVAANNTIATRTSTLTIANQTFTVTQTGGSNCVFTISPANQVFSASGGSGSINVSTQQGCNWTAMTLEDWIVITSGKGASGGGTVNFVVAVNASTIPRAGIIIVAGQTFIVAQTGAGATCGLLPISIGQTVNGELTTTDCRSPISGADYYADLWYFTARAGQQVAIQLNSSAFDAFLTLIGPDGDIVDEDDDGGGGINARIPATSGFLTLPLDGTYIIEASSSFINETGRYTLSLTAPAGCTYALAPASQSFNANGGPGSVAVTTQSGCPWTAASNVDWIVITSGASGAGSGPVNYSVAANNGANPRTGAITITGQTFTVTQSGGSNCSFTIAPTSQSFSAGGGTGSVNVTSQAGCNWTATSNAAWLTITSGNSGAGNGAGNYAVAANNGPARTGTLTVANQTFTVTQSANPGCSYTLAPTSQSFNNQGGSGNVNVITAAGCAWSAAANVQWITLQTGTESGSGNGPVGYSAAANNSSSARQGTITVAGQTFTVNQSGTSSAACPTISGINPTSGAVGISVTIAGANFTGVTSVRFANNVTAGFSVVNDTTITTTVPNGAVTGPITISKPSCADVQTSTFTVTTTPPACPTVSGINPASGLVGSTVTINGANFTGVTAVRFANNVAAQFTVNSDTQITATVPNGAVTGPITISKPNCPDAQTGIFTVTPTGPCIAVSIPTNLTGSPNATLTVPINVSDTTGKNALSYDAVLTFNPSVLRLQNPAFDRTGTLSANLTVTTNSPTAGRLNISGFSTSPLTGAGVLLYLKFDVIGALNACSDLNWTSFRFNEGTPCSTTSNGRACASSGGSIAGSVSYCASSPSKPVPGVTITASGAPSGSATTDGAGNYQLPNLGGGPYTITPAKTGDANGITSFDAAQIAQHVVQIITLKACQQGAADTSGNGEITSFDAAFIAQYVVGITNPDNRTGTWKFLPPSRAYASLSGNQAAQNFDAVLVGELTGNWTPGGGNALLVGQSLNNQFALSPAQVAISLPQVSAATGSSITIPITVGDLTGRNFLSFDFDLTYDASVLQAQQQPTDSTDTLSRNLTITANATPGRLRVSGFGAQAMSGAGTLLKLKFNVTGAAGTGTALTWQRFIFNETAQTNLINGRVNAASAVASVSAASFLGGSLAAESIVASFGTAMATRVEVASTLPLPTTLAGTTVRVRDSAGTERLASLFFVAPTQINFQIPPGTATGQATITVTSGDGTVSSGSVTISPVAPGFFTANASGQGVAAATVLRVKADGTQVFEAVARFDAAQNRFVAAPIDLGPEGEQVFLILFGTGFRLRSSLSATSLSIGGAGVEVLYAGAQGDFVGLDQLNARLPRSLIGRGEVDLVVTVDGRAANRVGISVR